MTSIEMRRRLHDPLTGLANRTMLSIQLDSTLARARRRQGALAVLYIDLDHFKHINDTHGHGAGDDALIDIAARMSRGGTRDRHRRSCGRRRVRLPLRWSRDDQRRHRDRAAALGHYGHRRWAGTRETQSLSIGIAFSATGEDDGETLLQNADLALYRVNRRDGHASKCSAKPSATRSKRVARPRRLFVPGYRGTSSAFTSNRSSPQTTARSRASKHSLGGNDRVTD